MSNGVDVYKLFPARVPFVDPDTGLLTAGALKALAQIVRLLGGEGGNLPVQIIVVPTGGQPFGIVYLNGSGAITSTGPATNGQFLIGRTGNTPILGALTGTANRIQVSNGAGSITISTPQDIHTGASPTFAALTLAGLIARSFLYSGVGGLLTSTIAPTNGQLLIGNTGNDPAVASLTGTASQVIVTNGPSSITLSLPQSIGTGSSPTFTGLTLSGLAANSFTYSGTGGALSSTAAPTNGQILIGSTGVAPVSAGITGTASQIIVTNGAGSITLSLPQDLATTSNVQFGNVRTLHLVGYSAAPAIAVGAGAGTGPTIAITGTDAGFNVTLTTGTIPTGVNAVVFTVTFAAAYGSPPHFVFSPANGNAAALSGLTMAYIGTTTTTLTLSAGTTALTAATQYIWEFVGIQ